MSKHLHICGAIIVTAIMAMITSPVHAEVTFNWITVGNPGNAADPLNSGEIPGIGSVANIYRIAKHEVTNAQYAEFLNAVAATDANGLYDTYMGIDPTGGITRSGLSGSFTYSVRANMGDKPVNFVSFFDAMRFVNWLANGQTTGGTESGVYSISDGISETRAADALFFIPTENEWYKAAYYDPTPGAGGGDNYWLYPTRSNSVPTIATANATGDISNPGANVANYDAGADWNGQDGNVTTVGSAGPSSASYYGTSDQGGNLFEWTEEVVSFSFRGLRGGCFDFSAGSLESWLWGYGNPTSQGTIVGFRVASPASQVAVPTVSEWGLGVLTMIGLVVGVVLFNQRRVADA